MVPYFNEFPTIYCTRGRVVSAFFSVRVTSSHDHNFTRSEETQSEELSQSSAQARSEVDVLCRSTPSSSLEPSLLAVYFLHSIRLMISIIQTLSGESFLATNNHHVERT
jgi:hypothetical protein